MVQSQNVNALTTADIVFMDTVLKVSVKVPKDSFIKVDVTEGIALFDTYHFDIKQNEYRLLSREVSLADADNCAVSENSTPIYY